MEYTFSLSRRSLPVRCLCLLLIVLVLWCFFMVPRAGAVAFEATSVAYAGLLVGTVLVGAGAYFASSGDMAKAGAAMYKTLQKGNTAIASKIAAISAWAVEHGKAIGSAALRIGKDLYQSIIDAFNAAYSGGVYGDSGSSGAKSFEKPQEMWEYIASFPLGTAFYLTYKDSGISTYWYLYVDWADSKSLSYTYGNAASGYVPKNLKSYTCDLLGAPVQYKLSLFDGRYVGLGINYTYIGRDNLPSSDFTSIITNTSFHYDSPTAANPWVVSTSDSPLVPVKGDDLVYPSDDYLVKMPDIPNVNNATGAITVPSDLAYTKDAVSVPYPTDADGVKVPDIPYDKVVDQSTGKTLDDTDTGTDTPSKPGEGTGTETGGLLGQIVALLKNFFDSPSDFKLDMDGFRNLAIKDKFPFCIPFDMVDSVKQFAADAADYQFRVKLDTQYFKVDHVVDLTPLAVPLAFFRYLVVAWFAWVLMSRTHDLMKW